MRHIHAAQVNAARGARSSLARQGVKQFLLPIARHPAIPTAMHLRVRVIQVRQTLVTRALGAATRSLARIMRAARAAKVGGSAPIIRRDRKRCWTLAGYPMPPRSYQLQLVHLP